MKEIRKIIREAFDSIGDTANVYYHGTRTKFPFQTFDPKLDSTGINSIGSEKFGGVFFTSELENAEFYTEYFICKVKINNIDKNPLSSKSPPLTMKQAVQDGKNYIIEDVLDGAMVSDVVVVPHNNLNDVTILEWIFTGEKEWYFESLDQFFGGDMDPDDEESYDDDGNLMEPYIDQGTISSFIRMTGGGLDFLLTIPIFKEYYESRN